MSPEEALAAARGVIADEGRWCAGANARDWWGGPVSPRSSRARRWCVFGALLRVVPLGDAEGDACRGAWSLVVRACDSLYGEGRSPGAVQDARGHSAALAMLDGAIALAEVEP